MDWVVFLVAVGLAGLWIVSLATGAAAAWFTWLIFVAAAVLFIASMGGFAYTRRRLSKPM